MKILQHKLEIADRIGHAGMDVTEGAIGFSQFHARGLIDLPREELGAAEAAFTRPAEGRDREMCPFQRDHEWFPRKGGDYPLSFNGNRELRLCGDPFRPAGASRDLFRRPHEFNPNPVYRDAQLFQLGETKIDT